MDLFLLRHGIAEDGRPGLADSDRALTREGRDKLRRVVKRAHEAGVEPTVIVSSPYRRALETAQIAAEEFNYRGEIVRTAALTPNASPADAWNELRAYGGEESIVLASHEPLMSSLLAYLLNSPALESDFKKGAMARVYCAAAGPAARGVLKWMITPALT
jgi:phosphohistidine phosphatase